MFVDIIDEGKRSLSLPAFGRGLTESLGLLNFKLWDDIMGYLREKQFNNDTFRKLHQYFTESLEQKKLSEQGKQYIGDCFSI